MRSLLGAGQATLNRLEGFLLLDGEDGPTVPIEIRVVDEGGIERAHFRVDRLGGGEDEVGHPGGLTIVGQHTEIIEGDEGVSPRRRVTGWVGMVCSPFSSCRSGLSQKAQVNEVNRVEKTLSDQQKPPFLVRSS